MAAKKFTIVHFAASLICVSMVAAAFSPSAPGTSLKNMSVEEMTRVSPLIVRARCVANFTGLDSGEIWTFTKFRVLETWRGSPPPVITVRLLGGTVGNVTSTVSGVPRFNAGEDVVLFLGSTARGDYSVVSWAQGTFRIRHDTRQAAETVSQDTAALSTFNAANHRFEARGLRNVPLETFRAQVKTEIRSLEPAQ